MARATTRINLTQEQRKLLQSMVRSREVAHSLVVRAQIILQAEEGINNKTIGQKVGLCEETISFWRKRWLKGSEELEKKKDKPKEIGEVIGKILSDKGRAGRPGKYSAEQIIGLIALACEPPPAPLNHWTHKDLIREAVKRKIVASLSTSSIGRFLKSGQHQTASHQILAQS